MAEGSPPRNDTPDPTERLRFMLEQLCSDLGELGDGLKAGAIPYEVVVQGALVQVEWVRGELMKMAKSGDHSK